MLEIKKLSGGYGQTDTVHDVSLSIPNGRITALIGPNGCGKSTLLKLICGQLDPKQGMVLMGQTPLSGLTRTEIARSVSYLPQGRMVPDITVESLVLHGRFPWLGYPRVYREEDKAAAEAAMETAGILQKRKKTLTALSGGERQKAYIAMTLAQNTTHVLLDEPTTYLDIAHQLELLELLRLLKAEGKAIAVVLHDINMVLEYADSLAVMKEGGLLAAGTPETVLTSGALEEAFGVRIGRGEQIQFFVE